jgi:hypothetical protein
MAPPPGVVPPPGMGAPQNEIVAPPGFPQPAQRRGPAALASAPVEDVQVDMDALEGRAKKARNLIIGVAAGASLLCLCGGYQLGNIRLQRDWTAKAKAGCRSTAEQINKMRKAVDKFEAAFQSEVGKTKNLKVYSPALLENLSKLAADFDPENAKIKAELNTKTWLTHYRFVKDAGDALPRFFAFLALCSELKYAVGNGQAFEAQAAELLKKKADGYKDEAGGKGPTFGVMIMNDRQVAFARMDKAIDKDGKPVASQESAAGFTVGSDNAFFPRPKEGAKPTDCIEHRNTVRIFSPTDANLTSVIKCSGQEDLALAGWATQIKLIGKLLEEMKKLEPKGIKDFFEKSGG